MEFRCRLGTAGGEILEGIYVAESEDRLRHELEEKGLYILSLQRRGGVLPGINLAGARRGRIRHQEFLVFNQELATLLKAGMPLVQSLDILRQRVSNTTFKAVLDDLKTTCEEQYKKLLENDTLDLDAQIEVLKVRLTKEGLS